MTLPLPAVIERIVRVCCPPDEAWRRLADFERAPQWDPRLLSVVKVRGAEGLGTVYHAETVLFGERADVRYRVAKYRTGELFQVRGFHAQVQSTETLLLVRGQLTFVHWMSEIVPERGSPLPPHWHGSARDAIGDAVVARLAAFLTPD